MATGVSLILLVGISEIEIWFGTWMNESIPYLCWYLNVPMNQIQLNYITYDRHE